MAATSAAIFSVLAISNNKTTPLSTIGGKRGLDIGGESLAGDPSDLRAHRLDRGHQRVRQRHRPQHVEAELGARLGVGRNAAWIVVGRAGNKPGTNPRQWMLFQAPPKDRERLSLAEVCCRPS